MADPPSTEHIEVFTQRICQNVRMVTCQEIKDGARRQARGGERTCAYEAPKILADIEIPEICGSKISIRETTRPGIKRTCIDPGNPTQNDVASVKIL